MYKIITTSAAIKEAFKKYHEFYVDNPDEFTLEIMAYDSGDYADLVSEVFLGFLEDASND